MTEPSPSIPAPSPLGGGIVHPNLSLTTPNDPCLKSATRTQPRQQAMSRGWRLPAK